jgi:hypothetical protein
MRLYLSSSFLRMRAMSLLASDLVSITLSLNVSLRFMNRYGAKSDSVMVMVLRWLLSIIVPNI